MQHYAVYTNPTSMFVLQILNTSGDSKTGAYIAKVCKDLIADLKQHCPNTNVAGFVMDSASANRSAMDQLDRDEDLKPMVQLQCAAHMLSLLMKDLAKRFPWVEETFAKVIYISNAVNNSEKLRSMFMNQCEKDGATYSTIPSHCDTRFGSYYMVADSVATRLDTLICWVGSPTFRDLLNEENETADELHTLLLGRYSEPDGLVKRLPVLKKLFSPIMKALIQVQADNASLCRMRALVRELEAHAQWFAATYPDLCEGVVKKKNQPNRAETLVETFNLRLRVFYYKPAITASFLLDPINFRVSDSGLIELPFEMLSTSEEDEAIADIERLAGKESDRVSQELACLKLNGIRVGPTDGLSNLNMRLVKECMLVTEQDMPDGSIKRSCVGGEKRMSLWLKILSALYPVLAEVAAVYLSMHSTSCASERNLSVFGRLYDKFRSRLQLQTGEKLVYLAVNDRIQTGQLDTSKDEVLFNDSDIEDDSAVGDVIEVETASALESLLAGTSQDDSEFLPAAADRRQQFFQ
jgi:hAT family C-terminal dimerisation region/Protein of unknown function (DUF 659)